MSRHYHKQRKKPPWKAMNNTNITSLPLVKIARLLSLIALISITMLINDIHSDQALGGQLGLSLGVQGASIRSDNSQLNRMTSNTSVKLTQSQSANQKQKAEDMAMINNNYMMSQGAMGKMFITTETEEKAKTGTLSQETIDAAAQITTDEANNELTKAFGQSSGVTRQSGTQQERNLLVGLDSVEEGSLENTLEETAGMSQEQEKTKSAVDATLEEIQKLHIIEQELAKAGTAETTHQKSKEINQSKIVQDTLNRIKQEQANKEQANKPPTKDKMRVEQLVQQQIEEQTTAIEDSKTMEQNADVLNYGNYIDNKEFTSTGELEDQQLQEDLKEIEKEDAEKEKQEKEFKAKQAQAAKDASEIDDTNAQHIQSQAALGDVSPTLVKGTPAKKVARDPLMPSKDASKLDLSGDLPFSAKKQKPKSQRQQLVEQKKKIAEVVKKSIAIQKQTEKQEKKDKKKIEAAEALFKFKQQHIEKVAPPPQKVVPKPDKPDHKDSAKTHELKKDTKDKVEKKKSKEKKDDKKKASKEKSSPNSDERDHEILQLDNLFLTVRESLVSQEGEAADSKKHGKSKKKSKHQKKKSKKSSKKGAKKGKKPKNSTLLQLESNISTSAHIGSQQRNRLRSQNKSKVRSRSKALSKNRLRQKRSPDLSLDEGADLELQALARSEIRMKVAAKNASKRDIDDSPSGSSTTIEVKDVSDSELEGTTKADQEQSSQEASQALKRQKRLEQIADERSDNSHENKPVHVSVGELMGEADADDIIEQANHEESQRVIDQQQRKEREIQEAAGEDDLNGGFVSDHDRVLKSTINDVQTEALVSSAEAEAAAHDDTPLQQMKFDRELAEASGEDYHNGGSNSDHDQALKSAINDINVDQILKNAEARHSQDQQDQAPALGDSDSDRAAKRLLEEQVFEGQHMRHGPPSSSLLVQVDSSVEAEVESESQAGAQSQAQAMIEARAAATAQAKAATEALAALGVEQKSQIKSQDQNLIDALKRTIGQLEAKQNPAAAAAAAKKKAVNNIQKALTNKILTRLDDSQPLINVFSKMQSLSKMMPQIQDFERRLGILHQVEPILENAISTLSKVVDLGAPLPAMPAVAPAPPPPPPPPPKPAAAPGLDQLKALLAQAQSAQAPAPAPAPESDDLSSLLGAAGGDQAISNMLGGASSGGGLGGLESLLGGAAPAADPTPQLEAPAFLQAAAAAAPAPASDPLAALGGLATGLSGSDESVLLSKLLGSKL